MENYVHFTRVKRSWEIWIARFPRSNTFSFKNIRFETPVDLHEKPITIRYERGSLDRVVIYYKGARIGPAKPLDAVANGLLKREGTQP
jgi:hypothetical protein